MLAIPGSLWADENVMILDVPDYSWHAGCFGTASGILMGFWDRNGLPDFYTGPTGEGMAPINSRGTNSTIRALWASEAGLDGRPDDQPGHMDDYWVGFEGFATDPYEAAGRAEHEPDCLGDFIGASQNKWSDLDGECRGNIDGFAFNFWDKSGERRWNFLPPEENGEPVREIQSGLREWAEYRGYGSGVFSQLVDFNPESPDGAGFTFEDLKAEIKAGYPVILFLQNPGVYKRNVLEGSGVNPNVHTMVAYGYVDTPGAYQAVRYRTSWGSGDLAFSEWGPQWWQAGLSLRGVIGFRPSPKLRSIEQEEGQITLRWDGPSAKVYDDLAKTTTDVHRYVIERATSLEGSFEPVTQEMTEKEATIEDCCEGRAFYRVRLVEGGVE